MSKVETLKQSILNKIALIKSFAINLLNKLTEENAGFIGHTVTKLAEDVLSLFSQIDGLVGSPNITQYRVMIYTMDTNGVYGSPTTETRSWVGGETVSVDSDILPDGYSYDKEHDGYNATGVVNEDGSSVFTIYIKRNTYNLVLIFTDGYLVVNNETIEGNYTIQYLYGQAVSIANYTPLYDGFTFSGWQPVAPTVMPANNVLLRALKSRNSYTVTWDVDGVTTQQTYEYEASIVPPADPQKDGYSFAGWSPSVSSTMPYWNVTYTATWAKQKYTLTIIYQMYNFEPTGVAPPTFSQQIEYEEYYSVPSPTGSGLIDGEIYNVVGHSADIPVVEGVMTPYDNIVVVTYSPNTYTVTWDVDGVLTTEQVIYNHRPVGIPDPTKEGYTFEGWYPYVNLQPAYDVTYTATWRLQTVNCFIDIYIMSDSGGASEYTAVDVVDPGWYWYKNNYDIYIAIYITDTHDYDTTKQYYKQIGLYPDSSMWHQTLSTEGVPGTTIDAEEIVINRNMIDFDGQYFDTEHTGYNPTGTLEIGQTLRLAIYIGRYYYTARYIQQLDDDTGQMDPYTRVVLEEPVYWRQILIPPSIPDIINNEYILSENWDVSSGDLMPAEDVTFTALYKRSFAVDLRLNGGTANYTWDYASYNSSNDILTVRGIFNTPLPEITATLSDWTFDGWSPSLPTTFMNNTVDDDLVDGTIYHACWQSQNPTTTTIRVNTAIIFEDGIRVYGYNRGFEVQAGKYIDTRQLKLPNNTQLATVTQEIRSGPGTSYNVVGYLSQHSPVIPLEYQNEWVKIDSDQWVLGSNLTDNYLFLFYNGAWKIPQSIWTTYETQTFNNIIRAVERKYPEFDFLNGYDLVFSPGNIKGNYIIYNSQILCISGTPPVGTTTTSLPFVLPPFFLYMKKPDGTMVLIDSLS